MLIATVVFLLPRITFADTITPEPLKPTAKQLNLSLPNIYTTPPPSGMQNDLSVIRNIYDASLDTMKTHKIHSLGLQRIKVDASMRITGWEIKDTLYFGQTRVGNEWGVGVMMTQGNFVYGLNNTSIGMTYLMCKKCP